MSSKLLIYIGENEKFDIEETVNSIASMEGISNATMRASIGAVFEADYSFNGRSTIVRLAPDAETVTVEGLGDESLAFALHFQRLAPRELHAIDMDSTFDLLLCEVASIEDFRRAIG